MGNKTQTISIGISALNEENNIAMLLAALLSQRMSSSQKLVEILVVSDGSTDNTCSEVEKIKDARIRLIKGVKRRGKQYRINQLVSLCKGDVLVLLDADVLLENNTVIATIAKPFGLSPRLGLVAGNVQPVKPVTLVEQAFTNYVNSLNFLKKHIRNGQNVFSVRGPLLALSKSFAKQVHIPPHVPDDRYLYFACLSNNYGFYYEEKAKVYFKSPTTIAEQVTQGQRYTRDTKQIYRHIDPILATQEYHIPLYLKIAAFLLQIFRNPLAYAVMKYIHLKVMRHHGKTYSWHITKSTKISYATN